MFQVPTEQVNQPPYVTFEKVAVENREKSLAAGHYVAEDVDYAFIMARGGKDRVEKPYNVWIVQQRQLAQEGRIPHEWVDAFERGYDRWKKGEEMLDDGHPLKAWGPISPAQLKVCLSLHINTVEQLAHANTEAVGRLGMQGVALKQRAQKWLEEAHDVGKAVLALEKATKVNETLQARNEELERRVAEMEAKLGVKSPAVQESADPKAKFTI